MKLKTLAGIVTTRWRDPQTCEACGQPFVCGATLTGCWCTEIKLTDAHRAALKTKYTHCLCRSCLEQFAQTDPNSILLQEKTECLP